MRLESIICVILFLNRETVSRVLIGRGDESYDFKPLFCFGSFSVLRLAWSKQIVFFCNYLFEKYLKNVENTTEYTEIFDDNFDFWPNFYFLTKTFIFDQNLYFWPKPLFLTKTFIFGQNFDLWAKFPLFWTKLMVD